MKVEVSHFKFITTAGSRELSQLSHIMFLHFYFSKIVSNHENLWSSKGKYLTFFFDAIWFLVKSGKKNLGKSMKCDT